MQPSTVLAAKHFREKVLPRKIEDAPGTSERKSKKRKQGVQSSHKPPNAGFHKARRDEEGGVLFPLTDFSFDTLAQFGLGVSVYIIQLCIVGCIAFISGCILLPSIVSFASSSYGIFWNYDPRLLGSAACSPETRLNVTLGCSSSESTCVADYREGCDIPETSVICDMVMSCVVVFILFFNMGIDEVEDILDEAVQTAQDYSIVVTDPDEDATDPEEWRKYFERYGRVRNVTITKKNRYVHKLLLQKMLLLRQLKPDSCNKVQNDVDFTVAMSRLRPRSNAFNTNGKSKDSSSTWLNLKQALGFSRDEDYYIKKLCGINKKIEMATELSYPACRVFVSFETEKEQRLCLRECATSYMESFFDMSNGTKVRVKFRGVSVLNVSESAEPNNIKWENLESSLLETFIRRALCWTISLGVIAGVYFAISYTLLTYPSMVSVLISAVNIALPAIFIKVTEYEAHIDEDDRQNSLLFKLYGAKLLTSVIFLYLQTSWAGFLDKDTIIAIIHVQIAACFATPFFKLLDPFGVLNRRILGPIKATSQYELNKYWEGSAFVLADRYTEISKVIFISYFYSLLTPMALFVAVISCITMFVIDRYLLFRKTKTPPMLDATMAKSLRGHSLFAIGVKIWVSCRFIYSWPMDDTYINSSGEFVKVKKEPPFSIISMQTQEWHSDSQKHLLIKYKWVSVVLLAAIVIAIVILPLIEFIKDFFINSLDEEESASSDKEYSRVKSIVAYCPVIWNKTESFVVGDTSKMLKRHMPEVVSTHPNTEPNLGMLLKEEDRPNMLATINWYGPKDIEADLEAENTILDDNNQPNIGARFRSAIRPHFGYKRQSSDIDVQSNFRLVDKARSNKFSISVDNDIADIAHIDMRNSYDQNVQEEQKEGEGYQGGMVRIDKMGNSRIRKSIMQRQKKSKVDIAPSRVAETEEKSCENDRHLFMRDEVFLLRQMRKEMLSVNVINAADEPNASLVEFDRFLFLVQKNAPSAVQNPTRVRRVTSLRDTTETKKQHLKITRTLLRRIYVKFIPIQRSLGSKSQSSSLLDWSTFVSFVQNGTAIELAALRDSNTGL